MALPEIFYGLTYGPFLGTVLGGVVLALLLWGIKQPLAWIVVSVPAIAVGVGCAVYGIAIYGFSSGIPTKGNVTEAASYLGGGAGGIVGGTILLIVALLRRKQIPSETHKKEGGF
jgi:hypothetical protein